MRVISGELKYRKIKIPEGIRPTSEKVREAVFSIIGDKIVNAAVLDLFAGSGCMGIEALSRGASLCVFNEIDRKNYKILKENIVQCGVSDKAKVLNNNYTRALPGLDIKFDIVIIDPPYASGFYENTFELLAKNRLVSDGGLIIAEHLYDNKLYDNISGFEKIKEKRYGTIGIDVFVNP